MLSKFGIQLIFSFFRLQFFTLVAFASCISAGSAIAQAPSQKMTELTQVGENVYSFRFFVHRNMIIVTNEGVIISDPLNPKAAGLMMAEIKKLTDKPVKFVIYSHNHWDHIAGAKIFKDAGATIIAHELVAKNLASNPVVIPPDKTFSGERYDVKLGGQTVELHHFGRAHGSGLVVMRLPKQKLLHTVDIVTPNRLAFRSMPDFTPAGWIKVLKRVEGLEFDRIIPGHGPAQAPKIAVTLQRNYIEDLSQAVKNAVNVTKNPFAFDKITELVKDELRPKYGKWSQFDAWMGMNVERITFEQRIGW